MADRIKFEIFNMEEEGIQAPQGLALFEVAEPKQPIDFELSVDENGEIEGQGEDDFYEYNLSQSDIPCNGTLIVKNKKTGELEAIPVHNYYLVSRRSKIHEFTKLQTTDTAALVNQFGTRQAKRIYNLRQGASKT